MQCISVRWIPNPGSSYSHGRTWTIPKSILDTKMSVRHHTKKITFFHFFLSFFVLNFFSPRKKKKKCYPLSFPMLGGSDSTRALQSAPFQNPGGVIRAWRTNEWRTKEILVSNFGFLDINVFTFFYCAERMQYFSVLPGNHLNAWLYPHIPPYVCHRCKIPVPAYLARVWP